MKPKQRARAFVAAFLPPCMECTLHRVCVLFLCYVTVQALADRYDHEYYWGVSICAWFWHALGIAWVALLFVMMAARFFS